MSTPESFLLVSDFYRVGGGFSLRFSMRRDVGEVATELHCSWHPRMPTRKELKNRISLEKYEIARHQFFVEVSKKLGGTVVCVDAGSGGV